MMNPFTELVKFFDKRPITFSVIHITLYRYQQRIRGNRNAVAADASNACVKQDASADSLVCENFTICPFRKTKPNAVTPNASAVDDS